MTSSKIETRQKLISWLPIIAFIVIAIVIRLYRTSTANHYLLAGSDGPYFPLQVKNLVDHFHLAFSDMPLLFTLGALLSKILYFIHIGTENECILLSIRFLDAFLPPLSAIPVFLIAKELTNKNIKSNFTSYLMVAFAILNFTPLFIFSSQLQKNGVAVFFVFLYIYYIVKTLKYENRSDFIKAIVVIILCAFTHFGSFGLLVFATLLIFTFWIFNYTPKSNLLITKKILLVTATLVLIFSLVAVFDFTRFLRIVHVPLKIFEAPVILFALNGQNFLLHGQTLLILVLTNLLAIQGIILILRRRSTMDKYKVIIGLSFAICSMLLSNPFLGLEWANRLFIMAYIPLTVLYLIIFSTVSTRWIRISTIFIFILLLGVSFLSALLGKPLISISKEAFAEFQQINTKIAFKGTDAIVSRQDLRLLSNWTFQVKGISDYLLTKTEFDKYSSLYFIKQIKGTNPAIRATENQIPNNYSNVFRGDYFEVYKIINNDNLPAEPQKIFKGIRGTIVENSENRLLIRDFKTDNIRVVFIKDVKQKPLNIHNGMKVEINGEWTPFSLAIDAETIKEITSFD